MNRRVATVAAVLALAAGMLTGALTTPHADTPARPGVSEDDPRFDCRRDGNRACGVQGSDGRPYVVTFDQDGRPSGVAPLDPPTTSPEPAPTLAAPDSFTV